MEVHLRTGKEYGNGVEDESRRDRIAFHPDKHAIFFYESLFWNEISCALFTGAFAD